MDDKKQFNAQAFEYHKKNQSAAWWERLEKAAIEESIISKAELLLTDKVKVSDDEIKLYFAASSVQAKVQQIFLNPALLIDTPAAETYYKENLSDFLKPEKRYVRHIIISDTDLTDDTAGCISSIKINNIYDKLRSGEKFEELANNFSDEPYKIVNEEKDKNDKKKGGLKIYKGGDLGWLTKEDLSQEEGVTENFIETVFNLKEYEISDIIRTQKGWQIVQATEIGDTEYYSLSDKAMVIKQKLVSDTEINKTLEKAKLIKSELTDTGANFIQLVKKYSNANSRDTQGIAGYIPRAEFTRSSFLEDTTLSLIKEIPVSYTGNGLFTDNEFSDSIFILKLNEVSAPIKSKLGIHIVKILDYKMPDLIDYKEEYPDSYRKILIMKARSIVDSWYKSEKKKSKIKYSFGEPNFLTKAEKSDR
ncbi:MAG TPA: peptidylprolyl isomerase [bacterium]|nr:peptidylprolyl isomerase [bacterium]